MGIILAIDAGTTGVRALAVNESGKILSESYKEFTQYFPQPGWVEHDPEEIWNSVQSVMSQVVASLKQPVVAIGITNQRETVVVWDRVTSLPLHRALVWQDRRTASRCEELEKDGLRSAVRTSTGLIIDPYFSATKIEWIMNRIGRSQKKIAIGTIDSWLIWKLTGGRVHATDASNASRTMLFNIKNLSWEPDLLTYFGVTESSLPDVRPSNGDFGVTSKDATCGANIPIRGIAGDQQSSLFGHAAFSIGDAKNTYGTGSFVLMNVGDKVPEPVDGLLSTVAWLLDTPKGTEPTYALEGSIFSTGATVQWLRDGLGIISEASELEGLALQCSHTGDVFIVPAFVGLGSPWWDPFARGTLIGLTRGTGKPEIARAAIESMVYQTRDVTEAMEVASGSKIRSLRVDGGASVMNLLLQLQADQLQAPVLRPLSKEVTALGAAYLAGLSIGIWNSLDDISANWKLDIEVSPEKAKSFCDTNHARWLQAVDRSRGWAPK
ncbi:MAG: glycerol kinase GlpK [Acidimicrobiales bacterium]|nr:glycerol kinase GlpK [Acidimicrobiales bacterium]MDG1845826.1 glycerol kinase GlpK [Acidimicrobiales bacterium]